MILSSAIVTLFSVH